MTVFHSDRHSLPSTRRRFLTAALVPLGSVIVSGCGGGGSSAAASPVIGASDSQVAVRSMPQTALTSPSLPGVTESSRPMPQWAAGLPLWQWYEIPNTALSSVDPAVPSLGIVGPRAKIDAWCGATLKRTGSVYMLGAAGGHADYAGNEVDALVLSDAVPQWSQLRAATPSNQIVNDSQYYLDGRPSSAHTYCATQFIDSLNRMVVFGSRGVFAAPGLFPAAPANYPFVGNQRSSSFNMAIGDWDSPDYIALFPEPSEELGALCVKHPGTDDVYYSRGSGWYRWTRLTNTWSRLSDETKSEWYVGAAIDPLRSRMLIVGGGLVPEVRKLDGSPISVVFGGLGAGVLRLVDSPGVSYDAALDRFIVVFNSGPFIKILLVNPVTWEVVDPVMTGVAPAARLNGIHNSAQYVPELKGMVVANRHGGNVLFFRTSS